MGGQSKKSRKRPWLAALFGTLATGFGHFYLRRWKRGLGWFVAAVAASSLFVPPEAARALLEGSGGDLGTLAPLLAVGVASVADAYVLARLRQQETRGQVENATQATPAAEETDAVAASSGIETHTAVDSNPECPECGEELDPDLDFCPWCTTRLTGDAGE
jgi:hypothetical protein